MINKNAYFFTVEGMDGAGKGSYLDNIIRILEENGFTVITTREPGGTELGEQIRQRLLHEVMPIEQEIELFFECRKELLNTIVKPALEKGTVVLCDRFTDSTYAYQGGEHPHVKPLIRELENKVQEGLQPDLTLLFDLPVEVTRQRLAGTGKVPDKFESKSDDFFENVRNSYLERVEEFPERFRIINSNQPKDKVAMDVENTIKIFLGLELEPVKKKKLKM
ncbi:TPA: dTMP kinase [Escherichia coli]|nr:dTMP kinase [Escherichia coli]